VKGAKRAKKSNGSIEELAMLADALGHPVRVKIVKILIEKSKCFCGQIVDELPLAQSTVSQHLKVLKKAGLVDCSECGTAVCYCVRPEKLNRLKELLDLCLS